MLGKIKLITKKKANELLQKNIKSNKIISIIKQKIKSEPKQIKIKLKSIKQKLQAKKNELKNPSNNNQNEQNNNNLKQNTETNNNNNNNNNIYKINNTNKIENEEEKLLQMAIKNSLLENYAKNIYEINENNNNLYNENINNLSNENINNIYNEDNNNSNEYNSDEEEDECYGICPITQNYMENPVLSPSGIYYEKEAILSWLKTHDTDPMTREKLSPDMLIEDDEYRKMIIQYKKKHNL